jgi:hypothetical protein
LQRSNAAKLARCVLDASPSEQSASTVHPHELANQSLMARGVGLPYQSTSQSLKTLRSPALQFIYRHP